MKKTYVRSYVSGEHFQTSIDSCPDMPSPDTHMQFSQNDIELHCFRIVKYLDWTMCVQLVGSCPVCTHGSSHDMVYVGGYVKGRFLE